MPLSALRYNKDMDEMVLWKQQKMKSQVLFTEAQIQDTVRLIAERVNRDFSAQEPLVVLVILNGAFIFAADLVRHLKMPTEIETLRLKSYEGTSSSGTVTLVTPLSENLAGKHVLIVEDIVETGQTMGFLIDQLKSRGAKSARICTLLSKPRMHKTALPLEYTGFEIGENFVVGYGLDLDGRFRNLPYIAELIPQ
jgi:hypoxanthine phosphoribosyltransferase